MPITYVRGFIIKYGNHLIDLTVKNKLDRLIFMRKDFCGHNILPKSFTRNFDPGIILARNTNEPKHFGAETFL